MRRRGPRPARRLIALFTASLFALAAVLARLVQLQVVEAASYQSLGTKQRLRKVSLPAPRGTIYDRYGQPLAMSVAARAVYADPRLVEDPEKTAAALAPLLRADAGELAEKLRRDGAFVYLARRVEVPAAQRILALRLPGIGTLQEQTRIYPGGPLAGQVLGFAGIDGDGLGGMEFAHDRFLRGRPGTEIVEQDPRGRPIPYGRNSVRRPKPGGDVVLTLDAELQHVAERALGEAARRVRARAGVAIVLDVRSGDVLAMANWPAFDPNLFQTSAEHARNRAVTDVYEPGSVNKVITAAAAIEAGLVSPATRLRVEDKLTIADKTFRDFEPHEPLTLTYGEVLARSSNVGTIKVALKLGPRRLQGMLERFGLGERTGVGFPGEAEGIMLPLRKWYSTSIGTIPIGQGIAVTPLQVATVYAAIANDGVWIRPRLVREMVRPDGTRRRAPVSERRRVISAATAAQVRSMLVGVVENGTGRMARLPGYLVGGKTGTARKPRTDARGYSREIVTTFAGLVPADLPRFVVLVSLDNPAIRLAALTAAPAFREIAAFALARYRVPPTFPEEASIIVPRSRPTPLASAAARISPSPSPLPAPRRRVAAPASPPPSEAPGPSPEARAARSPEPRKSP